MPHDSASIRETVKQIFTEYLKGHKYRETTERYAVLDAIYAYSEPFQIESLLAYMEEVAHFRVSRGTVYNTLSLLIDARLVVKHTSVTPTLYEKCYNGKACHRLVCTQCGRMRESKSEALQHSIETARLYNFSLAHYSLYVYGICGRCLRANKQKQKQKQKEHTKKQRK